MAPAQRRAADRRRHRRRRLLALLAFVAAAIAATAIALGSSGGGAPRSGERARAPSPGPQRRDRPLSQPAPPPGRGTGRPGRRAVPILMYHVIHSPPASARFASLYVPPREFAAQMRALAHKGYRGVTLAHVHAHWRRGVPLPRKPLVVSFDDGYRSQYAKALPVLRALHWPGVLNLQLELAPSEGGITQSEVRSMVAAGWEVDAHTVSHPDLTTLDDAALRHEVAGSRRIIQRRYRVPADFFCYPAGRFDRRVVAAVRSAGFEGATTTEPGVAGPDSDSFELPRVRVDGGDGVAGLERKLDSAGS